MLINVTADASLNFVRGHFALTWLQLDRPLDPRLFEGAMLRAMIRMYRQPKSTLRTSAQAHARPVERRDASRPPRASLDVRPAALECELAADVGHDGLRDRHSWGRARNYQRPHRMGWPYRCADRCANQIGATGRGLERPLRHARSDRLPHPSCLWGNRANEFAMRLAGATYAEIAQAGGGIRASVKATRAAERIGAL